jgi:hypothetical protein
MLRKSIVRKVGGFEDSFTGALQAYEDQAFLAKFYLVGTIYFANSNWIDYRVHADGFGERVRREGRYDEVRRHFLEWYLSLLAGSSSQHAAEVMKSASRALFSHRYPRLARAVRPLQSAVQRLRA